MGTQGPKQPESIELKTKEEALLHIGKPDVIHDAIQMAIEKHPELAEKWMKAKEGTQDYKAFIEELKRAFMNALIRWKAEDQEKEAVIDLTYKNKQVEKSVRHAIEAHLKKEKAKAKAPSKGEVEQEKPVKPVERLEQEPVKPVEQTSGESISAAQKLRDATIKARELGKKPGETELAPEKRAQITAKLKADVARQKAEEQASYMKEKSAESLGKINQQIAYQSLERRQELAREKGAEKAKEVATNQTTKYLKKDEHFYGPEELAQMGKQRAADKKALDDAMSDKSTHPFKDEIKKLDAFIKSFEGKKASEGVSVKLFGRQLQLRTNQKENLKVAERLRTVLVNAKGDLSEGGLENLESRIKGAIGANEAFSGPGFKNDLHKALEKVKATFDAKSSSLKKK